MKTAPDQPVPADRPVQELMVEQLDAGYAILAAQQETSKKLPRRRRPSWADED